MIIPRAIEAFLTRPRVDYRKYKKLTIPQLNERMRGLPVKPPIWFRLEHHQRVCFIIGAETGRFFFVNDTGTGKTLLAIALARYFRKLGRIRRVLVLVPNRINKDEWADQMAQHSPQSSYLVLPSSIEEKWEALGATDSLFVFETYAGFSQMMCHKQKVNGRNKLRPDPNRMRVAMQEFQGLVCDESQSIKDHRRLPYRLCRKLASGKEQMVFLLTATPFNRTPLDLWAQMFVVDRGETLGETLGLFRAAFFKEHKGYWAPEYVFDSKKEKLLNQVLANRSISYQADATTLPAVVEIRKTVKLPMDADSYYQKARELIRKAKGNPREIKNVFVRMRQITSGFLGYEDDETGEKARFVFDENPKLEMLLAVVDAIPPELKVVIFYEFTYSGELILKELKAMGRSAVIMYGKTKDPKEIKHQFVDQPATQVLVLQNRFGLGVNIQVAKYGIYYESPVSVIMRKQTRARIERQYALHQSVFLYDLVARDTIDEKILAFHKEGQDLFEALIRGQATL